MCFLGHECEASIARGEIHECDGERLVGPHARWPWMLENHLKQLAARKRTKEEKSR